VDRAVNLSQIPVPAVGSGTLVGPARPATLNSVSEFWAQGLTFGLAFLY
jgi:hypothetical protein